MRRLQVDFLTGLPADGHCAVLRTYLDVPEGQAVTEAARVGAMPNVVACSPERAVGESQYDYRLLLARIASLRSAE